MRQDRKAPEQRINDRIRSAQVRVIGSDGAQLGVMRLGEALSQARDLGLDLVEVSPGADPPVCRILDFGKFKYQEAVRAKEARKKQASVSIKDIRFRPKIAANDLERKRDQIARWLKVGHKVRVILWFRGRENARPDLGAKVLERLIQSLEGLAVIENHPKLEGGKMTMVVGPDRQAAARSKNAKDETEKSSDEAL